ncbi:hypothetical protein [Sinobacterium norvegicum]|uniref:hypothetical protein n=1 Tax=Sinobacterium norvegicum TaxID=1641715 RepID=UPI001F1F4BE8|nr:hypothetical protein [Sinobacterium norvegicum]
MLKLSLQGSIHGVPEDEVAAARSTVSHKRYPMSRTLRTAAPSVTPRSCRCAF